MKRIKEEEKHRKDIIQWLLTSWNECWNKKKPRTHSTPSNAKTKSVLVLLMRKCGMFNVCNGSLSLTHSLIPCTEKVQMFCRNTYRRFGPWHTICIEIDIGVCYCVGSVGMLLLLIPRLVCNSSRVFCDNRYNRVVRLFGQQREHHSHHDYDDTWMTAKAAVSVAEAANTKAQIKKSSCNERARFECGLR